MVPVPMVGTVAFAAPMPGMIQGHPLYSELVSDGHLEPGWEYNIPPGRRPGPNARRAVRGGGCPRGSKGGIPRRPTGGPPPPVREEPPTVTPLYKTRLCNFHGVGACRNGSSCSFAHGAEDLRPSPDFERTSVCPTMLNRGTCDRPGCRYAHKSEELRVAPGLLKTKMCSFFLNGLCVVGEACRFAHSAEELQEAMLVQKATTPTLPPAASKPNLWQLRRSAFGSAGELACPSPPGTFHGQELVYPTPPLTKLCSSTDTARQTPEKTAAETESILEPPSPPKVAASETASVQGEEQGATTPAARPAQVVRSKVIVQVDDDEDALPFMVLASSVSKTASAMDAPAQEQAALSNTNTEQPFGASYSAPTPGEDIAPARARRCRSMGAAKKAMMPKVMVDIEDFGAINEFLPPVPAGWESDGPALVELRRRGADCRGDCRSSSRPPTRRDDSRCGLQKMSSANSLCSLSGQFAECAMCPRSRGMTDGPVCTESSCAACKCGVKIIARNTFLTIADDKADQAGSKLRSRSH